MHESKRKKMGGSETEIKKGERRKEGRVRELRKKKV